MPENLEWKARLPDWDAALRAAQRVATAGPEQQQQIDTYFRVARGRLKLRQIQTAAGESAELIFYERSDEPDTKSSHYVRQPLADATSWLKLLAAALGSWAVVSKQRTIYWHENVRIHLDQVAGLGNFLEFEAVLDSESDRPISAERLQNLIKEFELTEPQGIAGSYSDFITEQSLQHKPR
jgi:predicted adenylyl cyclase CyaB